MKNGVLVITTILFIASIGNYFRITDHGQVRAVEFISILVIGILGGVLITALIQKLKQKS